MLHVCKHISLKLGFKLEPIVAVATEKMLTPNVLHNIIMCSTMHISCLNSQIVISHEEAMKAAVANTL